jgi:DNA-binding CsgD family transcriptional regulator
MCSRKLTEREKEILQLYADGKRGKEIAILLNLSIRTVESYKVNAQRKLKTKTLVHTVVYAIRQEMIK